MIISWSLAGSRVIADWDWFLIGITGVDEYVLILFLMISLSNSLSLLATGKALIFIFFRFGIRKPSIILNVVSSVISDDFTDFLEVGGSLSSIQLQSFKETLKHACYCIWTSQVTINKPITILCFDQWNTWFIQSLINKNY